MAKVSRRSEKNLASVDPKLATAVRQALLAAPSNLDFAVISGHRTTEEQHALWQKGRGDYGNIIDLLNVVTFKDGIHQRSRHQFGNAVDIVAYVNGRITWDESENCIRAAYIAGFAAALGVRLTGGFRWGWDPGHLELEVS
jgi:hypothetical protein